MQPPLRAGCTNNDLCVHIVGIFLSSECVNLSKAIKSFHNSLTNQSLVTHEKRNRVW